MSIDSGYFWFRLFKTKGIGPKSLASIAKIFEEKGLTLNSIPMNKNELSAKYPELAKILVGKIRHDQRESILQEYQDLQAEGIEIIYPEHSEYPINFLLYSDRYSISPVLFCKGYIPLLRSSGISIVGSRNVSEEGKELSQKIAADLAGCGMNIISGYAKGVDTNAHLGALQAEGTTTFVLRGCLENRIYINPLH